MALGGRSMGWGAAPSGNELAQVDKVAVVKTEPMAFLGDKEISEGLLYRMVKWFFLKYASIMHDFSTTGMDKLPKVGPALLVGPHTFHSTDILIGPFAAQAQSGRVLRGLVHKGVMIANPYLRSFGLFPGKRDSAIALLRDGNWCACIPGGIEEILHHITDNGDTAYEVYWQSHNGNGTVRKGFAEVALSMGPGFKVYPWFFQNGEEMKYNPLFELWCGLGMDKIYGQFSRCLPQPLEWIAWQFAITLCFCLSLWSLPVPVKVTMHVGDGVEVREGETAAEFRDRVRKALQHLADSKQGRRSRSYTSAIAERLRCLGGQEAIKCE